MIKIATPPTTLFYLNYGWETSFAAVTTSADKVFGHGVKVSSLLRKNNIEKIYGLGSRDAQKLIPKNYEGTISVDFVLANPWFFRAVLGTVSSTGTAPATHTYTTANTIPSFTIDNEISTDTASRAKLLGCKANTMRLTASPGELARVSLDISFATETHGSTTTAAVAETFDLFTFAHGELQIDSATVADVQNIELTFGNEPEHMYGEATRFATESVIKKTEISAKATLAFEDSATLLELLYGGSTGPVAAPAETADLSLTFTNSLTGSSERTIVVTITGIQLDEHNLPQDPTVVIVEDATMFGRTIGVVAENGTQTSP